MSPGTPIVTPTHRDPHTHAHDRTHTPPYTHTLRQRTYVADGEDSVLVLGHLAGGMGGISVATVPRACSVPVPMLFK